MNSTRKVQEEYKIWGKMHEKYNKNTTKVQERYKITHDIHELYNKNTTKVQERYKIWGKIHEKYNKSTPNVKNSACSLARCHEYDLGLLFSRSDPLANTRMQPVLCYRKRVRATCAYPFAHQG